MSYFNKNYFKRLYTVKISFKSKGKIKTFSDKYKSIELVKADSLK